MHDVVLKYGGQFPSGTRDKKNWTERMLDSMLEESAAKTGIYEDLGDLGHLPAFGALTIQQRIKSNRIPEKRAMVENEAAMQQGQ